MELSIVIVFLEGIFETGIYSITATYVSEGKRVVNSPPKDIEDY